MDELPMVSHFTKRWDTSSSITILLGQIYLAMLCTLLMWDTLPGFDMRWGMQGITAMLAFDVWLTAS